MKVRGIMMSAVILSGPFASSAWAAEKITVGALRFTSHAANFVAYEKGYFADAGLDVEFKFFQAAQPMALAIASGDVDFGLTAISGGLISLADKGAVKVIGGALQEEGGIDGQMILASKAAYDAGLKTPADLKGHSFGVTTAGSSFHYMAHKIADKEGFERKDIKVRPLQKVGAVIGALKSAQIDAWAIVPHIAKGLGKAPQVEVIGNVSDYIPNYQVTTVFTSTKNTTNNPELVKTFLSAYSKGAADFNAALVDKTEGDATADDMVKLIHKYVYADRPLEKAAPSIQNGAMRLNAGAALNMASVEDQLNWFKSERLVPSGVTLDKLVDSRFVETF
ncbi:putative aliphatic sulfonates-binding protein precursor [Pseudovibrio axinellae]|uniref:Putative aliphatic sulfonates-binding protein n=1 Tax=Pseudovibrio axinellae TaxID=989403 RepID=A0A161XGQ5_9HYPH|nr:ABC transporter substrate-binding protein [Pseudovibrio axinellae]KZL21028.1 putative aliphatic sulfonates-binding protein precursor [Pseudovibrio axinellae]SEP78354.1 NitT/TauT family transport system substrate-binding protein [Pseudovibrio axinellae]